MNRCWSLTLLALAVPGLAAEIRSLDVRYEDGYYTMRSEAWFDVGVEPMYDVFSSWEISTEFSSAIVEARDLAPDASGRPGFYTVARGCVLFFCKSLTRQGYVERDPPQRLRAVADPEQSDFEVSDETWEFEAVDGGTSVTYTLLMKPSFWVPPAIGPFVIKRTLRNKAGQALDRIESIARTYDETGRVVVD
ncbi:MAG: hypothetical protein P8X98_05285 [Woeseiaceae bacterium]|jgi:hypothetical protein